MEVFILKDSEIRTYTMEQVAELMHVHKNQVMMWKNERILKGIKTGKGFVFSTKEIERFLDTFTGFDVSNPSRIQETLEKIKKTNE